jgi:hypothetical protein
MGTAVQAGEGVDAELLTLQSLVVWRWSCTMVGRSTTSLRMKNLETPMVKAPEKSQLFGILSILMVQRMRQGQNSFSLCILSFFKASYQTLVTCSFH